MFTIIICNARNTDIIVFTLEVPNTFKKKNMLEISYLYTKYLPQMSFPICYNAKLAFEYYDKLN